MKRPTYLLHLLLMIGLLLSACGPAAAPTAAPAVEEPVTVVEEDESAAVPEAVAVDEFTQEELDASFLVFLADMQGYNAVGLEAFNEMLAEDPPPFILAVRESAELQEKGWIPGAVHIPLRELADHVDQLPSFDNTYRSAASL